MEVYLLMAFAYIFGAIPFSVIVPKTVGVDIMSAGSKNPGFTNVLRTCGIKLGALCLALDILKGFLPTIAAKMLGLDFNLVCLAGFIGVLGHCYSVFIGLKGGKGVAAAGGFVIALDFRVLCVALSVLILSLLITKYMSVASMLAAISLPVSTALFFGIEYIAIPVLYTIFIIFKHRTNIMRLLAGTENRFSLKRSGK